MIKNIFFDFNGTIIDDVKLCHNLLNEILIKQGKDEIDIIKYKNFFTFPIKDYYIRAGVSFENETYEQIAVWFIKEYMTRYLSECTLNKNVIEILKYLCDKGYNLYLLSASEINNLKSQVKYYSLEKYFCDILGISNIYAKSKLEIAAEYLKANNIDPKESLFIGDTMHDYELAVYNDASSILVSIGHQSKEVLEKSNTTILDDLIELKEYL